MKILFVSTNRLRRVMPPMPLGLASVIGQIDEGRHEIRVLDLMFSEAPEAELSSALASFGPDLIALSIRNIDNQSSIRTEYYLPDAKRLIERCRQGSSATIVVGGPAFTVSPSAIFDYLEPDLGIAGEGELAFRELVDRLATGEGCTDLPGLVWRGDDGVRSNPPRHVEDLDALRPPRRDLFDNARYAAEGGFANLVVKQGCSFDCLYCDGPHTTGRKWRMKSPETVADELQSMHQDLGARLCFFTDSIFNFPPEYAKEVCQAIIRRDLDLYWVSSMHPAFLDRDLLELMRDAGCSAISLGCDSCSDRMLKSLRKGFTRAQLGTAAEALEDLGIRYILSLLIGGPGEDRETVDETLAFLVDRKPMMVDFCVGIRLMPHTALTRLAVEEGMISADDPLMEPRFYLSPDVSDWIEGYLAERCRPHPNWTLAHARPDAA